MKIEFIDASEWIEMFRWPLIIGLPYVFSLIVFYTEVNWFTVPTLGLVAVAWVVAALSFLD